MAKNRQPNNPSKNKNQLTGKSPSKKIIIGGVVLAALVITGILLFKTKSQDDPIPSTSSKASSTALPIDTTNAPRKMTMEINQAIMVTEELDYGGKVPSIAEALQDIERVHRPEDGIGRTFAIIDAYGMKMPNGKLHISMHASTEKVGYGAVVFKRTGKVLWHSDIVPATKPASGFSGKSLTILVDDGKGQTYFVDGSKNPSSILTATLRELNSPVDSFWPDGVEREVTFIYSACGCPVKAKVKRVGSKTVRTEELPVLFPDDPPAVALINRLMGWQN